TKRPGVFAAFGRSLRIRGGAVVVPGGGDAASLWRAVAGTDPGQPDAFIARIFSGDGRLAFLYDTRAHLDTAHQRFALGVAGRVSKREQGMHALLRAFPVASPEWRVDDQ